MGSVALGASLASYLHARLNRQVNPNISIANALGSAGLVVMIASSFSAAGVIAWVVLLILAAPYWWRSVKNLEQNAA